MSNFQLESQGQQPGPSGQSSGATPSQSDRADKPTAMHLSEKSLADSWRTLVTMQKNALKNPALAVTFFTLAVALPSFSQSTQAQPDPKSVPVIDGGLGPCTADFTITDAAGAPLY